MEIRLTNGTMRNARRQSTDASEPPFDATQQYSCQLGRHKQYSLHMPPSYERMYVPPL